MSSTDIGGSVNSNPNGSNDVNLNITKSIGDERVNAAVGVFAAVNDHQGLDKGTVGVFGNVNANGHGAAMQLSHTPKYKMTTVNASATANLWTSNDSASSLNLNANASRHVSGPMSGRQNFGGALSFNHKF